MVARCEDTLAVHRSGEPVGTKLRRIAVKARKEPGFKFTSLYHLMNKELLRGYVQGWIFLSFPEARLTSESGKNGADLLPLNAG